MEPIDNDRWERLQARLELSVADAQGVLERVWPDAGVRAVEPMISGLANSNYRCEVVGHGPVLLRLHQRDPSAAARERALLARVRPTVPVAAVLGGGDDGPGGLPWTVQEFVEGPLLARLLEAGDPAVCAASGRACGEVLAAMQAYRFAASGELGADLAVAKPFSAARPFGLDYLEELLAIEALAEVLGADRVAGIRAVAADPAGFPWSDGTLCHGDFKGSNLIMSPDGTRVRALLDWEFAFAGPRVFDLAAMNRWRAVLEPGFLRGLDEGAAAAGAPLPAGWPEVARRVDLVNLASMLLDAPPGTRRRRDLLGLLDASLAALCGG